MRVCKCASVSDNRRGYLPTVCRTVSHAVINARFETFRDFLAAAGSAVVVVAVVAEVAVVVAVSPRGIFDADSNGGDSKTNSGFVTIDNARTNGAIFVYRDRPPGVETRRSEDACFVVRFWKATAAFGRTLLWYRRSFLHQTAYALRSCTCIFRLRGG